VIAPAEHPPTRRLVTLTVPGDPVAWARAGRGMGARTGGAFVTFTPEKQRSWKHLAQSYMREALAGQPLLEGPLELVIDAYWQRPKSLPKRLGPGRLPRPSRPDADNVGKQVCDSAIGVLYVDDAIVVDLHVRKWIHAEGEAPRVEILVQGLAP
jgi:Holliday junction resolvase RusA-like endonuclease